MLEGMIRISNRISIASSENHVVIFQKHKTPIVLRGEDVDELIEKLIENRDKKKEKETGH
jgi:hypothetical protein